MSENLKSPSERSVVTPELSSCAQDERTNALSIAGPIALRVILSTSFCAPPPESILLGAPVPKRCACALMSPGIA